MANLAGQRSLFLSKMSELEKPADGKEAGGLGAERSSFLSKAKYDDIVACLGQWECADKKVRRERWHQGHAWVKKYALFGTGSATVLIYQSDAQKQDVEQHPHIERARAVADCARSFLRRGAIYLPS